MMKRRVFLAGLFHETNTFVEQPAKRNAVRMRRGNELFKFLGDDSTMDGFLQTAGELFWDVIPGVNYSVQPSGAIPDDLFEEYWVEFTERLENAFVSGLDGIFLNLHGAMVTAKYPDVEGELLRRIRGLEGAEQLPIVAVLDLHANVTELMVRHSTLLIPYQKNPHTDARETAVRATRHLHHLLEGGRTWRTFYRHSRILLAPTHTGTADEPMLTLSRMARDLERTEGHLEIGIAPGFAHADTPDAGLTFWVASEQPDEVCLRTLGRLVDAARGLVEHMDAGEWNLDDAVAQIQVEQRFPALLVEPADNIGGGAPGDATFILRALLEAGIERCAVAINDPGTVDLLRMHAPGDKVRIALGGKGSRFDPGPVEMEVMLQRLTDGMFDLEDKQSHLAAMRGSHIEMGPCAVVEHRNVTILITSRRTPPFDLGQWRSQGIEPTQMNVIGVKAAVAHRRAYDGIARSSFTVRTPGPCSSDLFALPYQQLKRPIFPLDPL